MNTAIINVSTIEVMPRQADSDQQLIVLWLHGRPATTRRVYMDALRRFNDYTSKDLGSVVLGDLQSFVDTLEPLAINTRKRIIASIKSLFTFGQKLGYLRFNVAAALKSPKDAGSLAQRILSEDKVLAMIHKTDKKRDQVLIRLLYATGARISEICGLSWADVQTNGDTGQVTLHGKGGKVRSVKLSPATWEALQELGAGATDGPVFVSQKGGGLDAVQVHRIVKAAAKRAGLGTKVSAHWLRHAHASHSLDRGANIALVRDTLGHSSLAITSRYVHAKPEQSSALHLAV